MLFGGVCDVMHSESSARIGEIVDDTRSGDWPVADARLARLVSRGNFLGVVITFEINDIR